jgi:hypothetical protein
MLDPELQSPPSSLIHCGPSLSTRSTPRTPYTPRTPVPVPVPDQYHARTALRFVRNAIAAGLSRRAQSCLSASSLQQQCAALPYPMGNFCFFQKKGGRVCFLIAHPLLRWRWMMIFLGCVTLINPTVTIIYNLILAHIPHRRTPLGKENKQLWYVLFPWEPIVFSLPPPRAITVPTRIPY